MNKNSSFLSFLTQIKLLKFAATAWVERKRIFIVLGKVMILVVVLVTVTIFITTREYQYLSTEVLEQRGEVSMLVATLVSEHLDRMVDLGTSLSSQPKFQEAIKNGKLNDVTTYMKGIQERFPSFESMRLLDTHGILVAITPTSYLQDIQGTDFSTTDYFNEVQTRRSPYVSEIISNQNRTKNNVVFVAVPVLSQVGGEMLGVLALGVRLDAVTEWSNSFSVGSGGRVYIIGHKGQVISPSHLQTNHAGTVFSSNFPINNIQQGGQEVVIAGPFADGERVVVAYSPVPAYGWTVVVTQPASVAFSKRDNEISNMIVPWILVVSIVGLIFSLVLAYEEFLKREIDRVQMFLDSIGDGVVAIDRNWNVIFWNHAATALTGWSRGEAKGVPFRSVIKLLREIGRTEALSFIEDAIVSGNTTTIPHGTTLVKKEGKELPVGISASPIISVNGQTEGAVIIFRDTTKELEEEHLRSDFAYASHQLRTPITEAVWNLDIALEEDDEKKKKDDLITVHNSLMSIKKLAEHLVEVSRFDQGGTSFKIENIKIIDVLNEVQKKVFKVAEKQKTKVTFSPISPVSAIQTDVKILAKALFEVIENAIIYSPENSNVVVGVDVNGKNLVISIADHGLGIPEEEQPIIFTKFFRGSNRGAKSVGAGLGLFIAKECIKLLGGKIWFESEEDNGTTFYVSVPLEKE